MFLKLFISQLNSYAYCRGSFKQLYPLQNLGYVLMTGKSLIGSTAMIEKLSFMEYSKSSIHGTECILVTVITGGFDNSVIFQTNWSEMQRPICS